MAAFDEDIFECVGSHIWIEPSDGVVYCSACGVDLGDESNG